MLPIPHHQRRSPNLLLRWFKQYQQEISIAIIIITIIGIGFTFFTLPSAHGNINNSPSTTNSNSLLVSDNNSNTESIHPSKPKYNKIPQMIDLSPPLSRQTLGHSVWSFLHTTAAIYPVHPTLSEQLSARQLIDSISQLYPCKICGKHFRKYLQANPFQASSRQEFSEWLCNAHNGVNQRLDKPIIDCNTVNEIWPDELYENCGCNEGSSSTAAAS